MQHVFVFGSNLAGRHGAGAAAYARQHYGAVMGHGIGRTGNAWALPTKDERLNTLPLDTVELYWKVFRAEALTTPDTQYLLTPFGTGLAGLSMASIRHMVQLPTLPRNIWLTADWFR